MKCPKIEAIQSKTRGRLGHFCNNSALDYSYQKQKGGIHMSILQTNDLKNITVLSRTLPALWTV